MLDRLLPQNMARILAQYDNITELRVRVNTNLIVYNSSGVAITTRYIVSVKDIEHILMVASAGSLYSVTDMLNKGYLIYDNGIRIGIVGEGVIEEGKLISVKNITFMTIRVPKEIEVNLNELKLTDKPLSTLIISPPGAGKTTLLRAITRYYSDKGKNILLIDERYELASVKGGKPVLNVGKFTDVISGIPKSIAYEIAVRTMRPDIISTDEVYDKREAESLVEAAYCGIKIFATVHASSIEDVKRRNAVSPIIDVVEQVIVLSNTPRAGTIIDTEVLR